MAKTMIMKKCIQDALADILLCTCTPVRTLCYPTLTGDAFVHSSRTRAEDTSTMRKRRENCLLLLFGSGAALLALLRTVDNLFRETRNEF